MCINNMQNCNCNMNNMPCEHEDMLEDTCQNVCNMNTMYDECECGFGESESYFPTNPMLGQSYVPIQRLNKTFIPKVGLKMGTIFPELVSPYRPGQSMEEIEYIKRRNTIGEGCNQC